MKIVKKETFFFGKYLRFYTHGNKVTRRRTLPEMFLEFLFIERVKNDVKSFLLLKNFQFSEELFLFVSLLNILKIRLTTFIKTIILNSEVCYRNFLCFLFCSRQCEWDEKVKMRKLKIYILFCLN